MNIMNKLYKCALGLLTTFILTCCCFSNALELPTNGFTAVDYDINEAGYENSYYHYKNGYSSSINISSSTKITLNPNYNLVCFRRNNSSCQFSLDNFYWYGVASASLTCWNGVGDFYLRNCSDYGVFFFKVGEGGLDYENYTSLQCQTEYNLIPISSVDSNYCNNNGLCPNQYTSLECQTEYNLIPIESVTAQYCKLNYDLISPTECPTYEGTGAINRTAWYINNEQFPGTASLNIFIPEFIKYSTTYNENQTIVEVEGYNADEEYIENVINNEKLTPTNEDFEQMLTGFMTNYFPYLALALVFLYLARKIFKIFK